jgi:hypothetical protein
MGRLYRMLFAAAAALLAAAGCDKFSSRVEVEDTSFEVESSVYYSGDWQRKALGLKLASGEDGSVTIYYSIDGNEDLRLLNTSQKEFESGSSLTLSRKTTQVLLMPNLSNNRHVLSMEFVKDGVSRSDTLSFTVNQSLSLSVNASDALQYTRFSVTGQSGSTTLAFYLDGSDKASSDVKYLDPTSGTATETGETFEVNFDEYQTWEFEFPYLTPGDHTVTVTSTTSNETVESYTRSFSEPTRKAIALKMTYDRTSRALLVSSTFNPAKVKFNARVTATASGSIKYRPHRGNGIADPETKSVTGDTFTSDTTFCVTPNDAALIMDGHVIAKALESCHAINRKDYHTFFSWGGGGGKTVYTEVKSVDITVELKSVDNETPGETQVVVDPSQDNGLKVAFRYSNDTYDIKSGTVKYVTAKLKLNGHTYWGGSLAL